MYQNFLGCNSYSFVSIWQKNVSVEFWQFFRGRAKPTQPKLKTGARWLRLAPKTYPYNLWCSFYCFLSIRKKNNSVEFCRLFGPQYHRGGKSWKLGPYDSVLHPKHTHIIRDAVLIILRLVRLKNVLVEFGRLFRARALLNRQSWKLGPDDSVLTTEIYPNYSGHISRCFWFVREKTV